MLLSLSLQALHCRVVRDGYFSKLTWAPSVVRLVMSKVERLRLNNTDAGFLRVS